VELPPTERMGYWLGQAARGYRESAGVVRSQIAGAVAVDQSTVARFEAGQSWPREIDEMLDAYAKLSGLDAPRDIWERALGLWAAAKGPEGAKAAAAGRALEVMAEEAAAQRGKGRQGSAGANRRERKKKATG
jgi:transcriptional regulator with XRE-family HTH domain